MAKDKEKKVKTKVKAKNKTKTKAKTSDKSANTKKVHINPIKFIIDEILNLLVWVFLAFLMVLFLL